MAKQAYEEVLLFLNTELSSISRDTLRAAHTDDGKTYGWSFAEDTPEVSKPTLIDAVIATSVRVCPDYQRGKGLHAVMGINNASAR